MSGSSDTFFSLKLMVGTSLFWPFTTPTSNQPVETSRTSRDLATSAGGLQPAPSAARTAASRTKRRMRAILEHSHDHPAARLLARELGRQIRGEIGSPHADHDRPRIVGHRAERGAVAGAARSDGDELG